MYPYSIIYYIIHEDKWLLAVKRRSVYNNIILCGYRVPVYAREHNIILYYRRRRRRRGLE